MFGSDSFEEEVAVHKFISRSLSISLIAGCLCFDTAQARPSPPRYQALHQAPSKACLSTDRDHGSCHPESLGPVDKCRQDSANSSVAAPRDVNGVVPSH